MSKGKYKSNYVAVTDEARFLAERPYHLVVYRDEDGGWCGTIPELPGLVAAGDTFEEMIVLAEDAKNAWITVAVDTDFAIPDPFDTPPVPEVPDVFVLPLPTLVRATLAREASEREMSMASLNHALRKKMGYYTGPGKPRSVPKGKVASA